MGENGYALGRIAVPIVFIVFGVIQFMNIDSYVANAGIVKFVAITGNAVSPRAVAWAVAAVDLIGGALVLIGFMTRPAALVLLVFTGLTIYFSHPFWEMDGAARAANQAHALKNLSIMGALLMIASIGAGRFSVDGRKSMR